MRNTVAMVQRQRWLGKRTYYFSTFFPQSKNL